MQNHAWMLFFWTTHHTRHFFQRAERVREHAQAEGVHHAVKRCGRQRQRGSVALQTAQHSMHVRWHVNMAGVHAC